MNPKGVCKECGELVCLLRLKFAPESKITESKDSAPLYLCGRHPPKDGCKKNEVVSIPSGEVVEVNCNGTMRPPKELVQVH